MSPPSVEAANVVFTCAVSATHIPIFHRRLDGAEQKIFVFRLHLQMGLLTHDSAISANQYRA